MEPAEQEVAARQARRLLWAFRALVYGGAAIAIALLLTGRSEGDAYAELDGHTARFDVRDGALTIADVVYRRYEGGFRGRREFELRADLDGRSADGSIRFIERIWRPDGTTYVCESPEVTFSAG